MNDPWYNHHAERADFEQPEKLHGLMARLQDLGHDVLSTVRDEEHGLFELVGRSAEHGKREFRVNFELVNQVEFRFFTDPATRAPALETGEADVMGEIPPQDVARLEASDDFRVEIVASPGVSLMLFLNMTRPPLDDLKVRQALLYATQEGCQFVGVVGALLKPPGLTVIVPSVHHLEHIVQSLDRGI